MRQPFLQLYVHFVWATWDRLPLITPQAEARIYNCIAAKCHELKCDPIAIGGIEDHVHLLVRLAPTVAPATLIGGIKGATSHLMTHIVAPETFFKWQGAYGAFTIRKDDVPGVSAYIANQREHHAENTIDPKLETIETAELPLRESNST
jgi:REP element-mobilizing transposase RayT